MDENGAVVAVFDPVNNALRVTQAGAVPLVQSPGALVDVGPTLQAALDAHKVVQLDAGQSYYLATPIFLDSVSDDAKYVIYGNGATLTLAAGLPVPSTWDTSIGAAPPTAFFNGTLRAALSGGTVTTTAANGAPTAPVTGRFVIHDLRAVSSATKSCLIFGGTSSNAINGSASGMVNCALSSFLAGIAWSGYADGNFAEGCDVAANPSADKTRIIYQRTAGDGTRVVRCKAYLGFLADISSSRGFKIESCISGQINVVSAMGQITTAHQETDEASSAVAWSVSIDRSHVTIIDHYSQVSNNVNTYSIVVNDTSAVTAYVASEVVIRGWRPIANYVAAQGDAAKGPSLRIIALNTGGRILMSDTRGAVIVAGTSVGWQAPWISSADSNIQAALTAGGDFLATGNWVLSYAGAWSVGPARATPAPRALAALTLAGAVDAVVTGATLVNTTMYEYMVAVVTAQGGYGPMSAAVQVTAGAGGAVDLTITNPVGACQVIVWRKTGAGVAATPDHYIVIGLDAYLTSWIDTGVNFNGRPWITSSIPVPNTVASTGPQVVFPSLQNDILVRKTADEAVTSSTTFQNDDHLFYPLLANAVYEFTLCAFYDASTAGDAKFCFTVPSGATLAWGAMGATTAATTNNGSVTYGAGTTSGATVGNVGGAGAGTKLMYQARGLVVNGSTAGLLQLQWAQATSDGTATNVFTGSYMIVRRVA